MVAWKFWESFSKNAGNNPQPYNTQTIDPLIVEPFAMAQGNLLEVKNWTNRNKYTLADQLVSMDERLWAAIELSAIMIKKSFAGPTIENLDGKMTNEEENALLEAQNFVKLHDVESLYYNYTIDLWKYADAVDKLYINSQGITKIEPLPMNLISAVDKREQIGHSFTKFGAEVIRDPKLYVVDEMKVDANVEHNVIKAEKILHISFNPRRQWTMDNLGRWTFNVWSHSPLTSLITLLEWKHNLIKNDILWRNRMLPREHHQLDMSMFSPDKYNGDYNSRVAQANAAALAALKQYSDAIKRKEGDQGYITGNSTKIGVVEPKSTNYNAPSEIINQINTLIASPIGIPDALVGGEAKGFTSLIHSSGFAAMRSEIYADRITKKTEQVMRRHVRIVRPGIRQEVIDRLVLRNRIILDRDRTELAKIIAILVGSKAFTMDEIRAIWGLDPMTEKQVTDLVWWLGEQRKFTNVGQSNKSPAQVKADLGNSDPTSPTSRMQTQGKRDRDLISTQRDGTRI